MKPPSALYSVGETVMVLVSLRGSWNRQWQPARVMGFVSDTPGGAPYVDVEVISPIPLLLSRWTIFQDFEIRKLTPEDVERVMASA